MIGSNATLYYRYGAYELKARYQANLLIAQLLVLLTIGAGIIAAGFETTAQTTIVIPAVPRDSVVITLGQQVSIRRQTPQTGGPGRPSSDKFGIPTPVDDSTTMTNMIPTRDDLSLQLDADTTRGLGDSSFVIDTSLREDFPQRNVFIPCDSLPFMIREVKPDYPALALQAGLDGRVIIDALIDKEGRVREVVVRKSSGVECLDSAATKAAWKCLYRPAIQNGHPLTVWVTYPVAFRLK